MRKIIKAIAGIRQVIEFISRQEQYRNCRYSAYATKLKLSAAEVWRLYRGRANAENHIKELKYDFGFDSLNLKGFYATEAALTSDMIAYNLMSLLRQFILHGKTQKRLSTLPYRTLAIGTYFEKINDQIVLKMALVKKRRKWFTSLWNQSQHFDFPFSNA